MKKLLLLGVILLGAGYSASAHDIPVSTSCGKTVVLKSEDYKDADQMIKVVIAINDILCP